MVNVVNLEDEIESKHKLNSNCLDLKHALKDMKLLVALVRHLRSTLSGEGEQPENDKVVCELRQDTSKWVNGEILRSTCFIRLHESGWISQHIVVHVNGIVKEDETESLYCPFPKMNEEGLRSWLSPYGFK